MFLRFILSFLFVSCAFASFALGVEGIVVGDSVNKVYLEYGTPKIEFPLRGLFIQEYENCIVKSRDGKVIAIIQSNESMKKAEAVKDEPKTLPVKSVRFKAENGDADSQYYMAYWNQTGQCIPKNMEEAVDWYSKAAYQGHVAAQHNLGVLYMTGDGVKKDLEHAYIWALLAAENGNDTLKEALFNSLSDEQKLASMIRADQIRVNLLSPANEENSVVDTFTVSDQKDVN